MDPGLPSTSGGDICTTCSPPGRPGLAAAEQGGDPAILFLAHRSLGNACAFADRHADALDHLGQALDLAEGTGDLLAQAHAHRTLAWAFTLRGRDQRALEHATSALPLFQAFNQPVREADMLNTVGWCLARLGHYEQAQTYCEAALVLSLRHHYRVGEAHALDILGYLAHHTGHHDQALDYYQQALTLRRDLGDTYYEATSWTISAKPTPPLVNTTTPATPGSRPSSCTRPSTASPMLTVSSSNWMISMEPEPCERLIDTNRGPGEVGPRLSLCG